MRQGKTSLILGLAASLVVACGGPDTDTGTETAPPPPGEATAPAETPEAIEATETAGPAETADAGEQSVEFAGFPEPYSSADYSRGRRIFTQCKSCHSIQEGGPAILGPNLHGLFGREVGTKEGYAYSEALQEADFTWSPDKLEQWLASPRDFLPGNKMSFAGIRRPDDRHAVIAYIMAESGYEPS